MRCLFRLVTKPGGAALVTAFLSARYQPKSGERVLVCGGKTAAADFGGQNGALHPARIQNLDAANTPRPTSE